MTLTSLFKASKTMLSAIVLAALMLPLSACSTMEGFGKDLQKVGEHIEEDADKDGD